MRSAVQAHTGQYWENRNATEQTNQKRILLTKNTGIISCKRVAAAMLVVTMWPFSWKSWEQYGYRLREKRTECLCSGHPVLLTEMHAKARDRGEEEWSGEETMKTHAVLPRLPGVDTYRDKIPCLQLIQMRNSGKYLLSSPLVIYPSSPIEVNRKVIF